MALIYGNEYLYKPNSQPVEYIADIIIENDVIDKARREIEKQVAILDKRDAVLSAEIEVREIERSRIREVKMSFSSALK